MTCPECLRISERTGSPKKIPYCKLLLAKLDQLSINRERGNKIIFERARAIAAEKGLPGDSCPNPDLADAINAEIAYLTPSTKQEDNITPCPVFIATQYPIWQITKAYQTAAHSLDNGTPLDREEIESLIAHNL